MPRGPGYGGRSSWTRSARVRPFYDEARAVMASLRARAAAPGMCPRELWLPAAARLDGPVLMV
jgi:hypothetical protein